MRNMSSREPRRKSIGEVLRRVRTLVRNAAIEARRPPVTETRRRWSAVQAYLDPDAWRLIWHVVDYLRDRRFDLLARASTGRHPSELRLAYYPPT
jgi:hypothetical protein